MTHSCRSAPFVVVEAPVLVVDALLLDDVVADLGVAFECAVEALEAAVLLWLAWLDSLQRESEPEPPERQSGEATCASRRERRSVVGANGIRQPELLECRIEDAGDDVASGFHERLATKEVAAVGVHQGEGGAIPKGGAGGCQRCHRATAKGCQRCMRADL